MTERSAGLPSQKQVIELLDGEFARAGYEIEDVVDRHRGPPAPHHRDRRRRRSPGSRLDRGTVPVRVRCCWIASTPPPYVLEVTSPGVDRPLTTEKHYRRARGRKVELTLSDGSQLTGRLGEIHGGTVRLVVREGARANFSVRELPVDGITKAVVQVEFSPPNQRELELAGQSGKEASA